MTNSLDIDLAACRARQKRLLEVMGHLGLDQVIVTHAEQVQWLSGARFTWFFSPCAALGIDGHLTLVAPAAPAVAAADEVVLYPAKWTSTLRDDQRLIAAETLVATLAGRPKPRRAGVEFSSCGPAILRSLPDDIVDIAPEIYRLRRRKDPDELATIRKAIAATGRMYETARKIVAPGVSELEVFNQLQSAAVLEFGEMMTGTGNDYACAMRGGPPRDRQAQAGELYILDLGPAYRGYFSDNCRTIAVDRKPTDEQHATWQKIISVIAHVERVARAGTRCRELWQEAKGMLDGAGYDYKSHLGHGIGLSPHERPHLNPQWDDTLEAGDVIAVEPGIYLPQLRAGVRVENNYLVTESGLELLSDFPLGLV